MQTIITNMQQTLFFSEWETMSILHNFLNNMTFDTFLELHTSTLFPQGRQWEGLTVPQESGPPLKRAHAIRTTSASIFLTPGNRSGWRGLDQANSPYTCKSEERKTKSRNCFLYYEVYAWFKGKVKIKASVSQPCLSYASTHNPNQ